MKDTYCEERERIIARALSANTLSEIEQAAQALRVWIEAHPDDLSAEDALEPLALRRQGLLAQEAKTSIVTVG
jgi:hypothetical protein